VPRIGWLEHNPAPDPSPAREGFRQGLQELGYIEGQNILVEYRLTEGQGAQPPDAAAALAQLPVDVMVATVTTVEAARQATRMIPIVIVYPGDPVRDELVASLARPAGNVTGLSYFAAQLSQKRLELLSQTVPGLSRVAVLQDANRSATVRTDADLEVAAQALRVRLQRLDVREPGDWEAAFESATSERADALLLSGGTFFFPQRARLVALAAQYGLPTMYWAADSVHAGGLMAYAPDIAASYRRAAYYVDRILKGAKPADLPVEQPMTFDFVVNLKTARELGITFPNEIMLQVTEVVQ
jgi:putative ABC transport system substrate-binding protein